MTDSNNRLLSTLVAMQLLTLGILVVMLFNSPPASKTATVSQGEPKNASASGYASASPFYQEPVSAELKTALREILREELASLTLAADAGKDNEFVSQPDKVLSADELMTQETAAMVSTSIIQQATSAGVWTQADTNALLPHLGSISGQQRLALMDQLFGAINRQEMDIQDFPPL